VNQAARAAIESGLAARVRSLSRMHPMADPATLRILIVEDNRDSAGTLKVLLEGLGYQVQAVNDGESAVRAAAVLRPQVILMDIAMPGMDGYEAARRIRAQSPDMKVRIVALTGLGQQIDRLHSAEAGIDHHLVKPLELAVLQPILDFTWKPGAVV
jgi:CheY-like chemotaxis protein